MSDQIKGIQNPLKGTAQATGRRIITLSGKNTTYRLHKDRIVLGSVISADVRLTGDGVSPIHAVLETSATGDSVATIYDLASETGVFVNGNKAVTQKLKAGDEITIGRHSLKFGLEDIERLQPETKVRDSGGRKLFMNPNEDIGALLLEDERTVQDIFDYRPTHQQALQVVMSWKSTVMDVEHFVDEPAITLGQTRKSHFGIPPLLGNGEFAIVTRTGQHHILNLDPHMKGVIQRKGELKTLDEMRASVVQGASGSQVPLEKGDFAKISVGEIDFYLSFTAAPPRLKPAKLFQRDALFVKIMGTSLTLTALTVGTLLKLPVDQRLEAEEVPERIATILYQPEKFAPPPTTLPARPVAKEEVAKVQPTPPKATVPPPKPKETVKIQIEPKNVAKPVPKEMNVAQPKDVPQKNVAQAKGANTKAQNEAQEGKGARAKGTEGARGDKKAAPGKDKQNLAMRPSPMGGAGRGSGDSQIRDEGNLDILKGASGQIQDLLGNSAAKLGKGGEKLKGFGAFNTQGEGGLALSGTGRGGGGDAASLGGLSDKGRGGGKVGTGLGAAGSGSGIIGGSARVVLRTGGPEEAVVMGTIDASAIEAAILAHRERFRLCYEKEINAESPAKGGRVGTTFVIGSNGRVTQAGIESTTLNIANTESCIVAVIKTIQFPIPRGAGVVQVMFPFKFNPIK